MGRKLRFTLPDKTHTHYMSVSTPVRYVNVVNGDVVDVDDMQLVDPDDFVRRGMAEWADEDDARGAQSSSTT